MKTKIILSCILAMFISTFCFAQNAEKTNNRELLQKYTTLEKPFKLKANIEGIIINYDGRVHIPSLSSSDYTIRTTSIESEFLRDRMDLMDPQQAVIVMQLSSTYPKTYELLYIYSLMTVAEFKEFSAGEGAVVLKEEPVKTAPAPKAEPKVTKKSSSGIDYDARFKKAQDLEKKKRYYEAYVAYTEIGSDADDPHCYEAIKKMAELQKKLYENIPGVKDNKDVMETMDAAIQYADMADQLSKQLR